RRPDATPLLEDLVTRVGADPETTLLEELAHPESKRRLAELFPAGEDANHLYSKANYFEQTVPADGIETLLAHLTRDRVPGETRILDFMPWGGAYGRTPVDATAFVHRRARFLLKHEVATPPERTEW